jgi:hypothetical protein
MNLNAHFVASRRTRAILEDLEAVRENLLALSDDIWQSIDHNDSDSLEEGVAFKRTYNEKLAAFDSLATELSVLVQQFTSVNLAAEEKTGGDSESENQRIIQELDRDVPHSLDEDFTWKRPHGFILLGRGTTGITTWKRLFELVCLQLLAQDRDKFRSLVNHPDFVSKRGHHSFSHTRDPLRSALQLDTDLFTEINLSANSIRDTTRRILDAFQISIPDLKIFLREDRDA